MEYTAKPSKYDAFDQQFGRVARSGKAQSEATQPTSSSNQQEQFLHTSVMSNQNFGPGVNPPSFDPRFGPTAQTGYQMTGWNTSQNMGPGFYPQGYNQGPVQYGQSYQGGNPYSYQTVQQNTGMMSSNFNYEGNFGGSSTSPGFQHMANTSMGTSEFPIQSGSGSVPNTSQISNIPPPPQIRNVPPAPQIRSSIPPPPIISTQPAIAKNYSSTNDNIAKLISQEEEKFARGTAKSVAAPVNQDSELHSAHEVSTVDGSTEVKITEGMVTFCCDQYGFVGPEIFYAESAVRGDIKPKLGDLVLVEAERVNDMKFKYAAKRVQVLSANPGSVSKSDSAKPLRNPPPPPMLSKLTRRSRSRSRSKDRYRRYNRRDRSRSRSYSPYRSSRRRRSISSRSRSPSDRRRTSHHRERSHRSKSRSSSIKERSPTKHGRKDMDLNIIDFLKSNEVKIQSSSNKVSTFLEEINASSASFTDLLDSLSRKDNSSSSQNVSKPGKTSAAGPKNIDLVDYNIWGIPADLPQAKKASSGNRKTAHCFDVDKGHENEASVSQRTKSSKSKQISIKLGFMEKEKIEKNSSAKGAESANLFQQEHLALPRNNTESTKKTKQDLFRDHLLGSGQHGSQKEETASRKLTKTNERVQLSSKESGGGEKVSSSLQVLKDRAEKMRAEKKEKEEYENRVKKLKQKQRDFEKRLQEVEESRKKTPPRSRPHGRERSRSRSRTSVKKDRSKTEVEKIAKSLHKRPRKTSPKVSLIIPSSDLERSPTPTEEEILERQRTIKLRELQLDEDSRLWSEKVAELENFREDRSASHSPKRALSLPRTPSPKPTASSRSRRYRKSRSRSPWSESPEPSENEKLVRNLGIRHSLGTGLKLDEQEEEKGSKSSVGYSTSTYRGMPVSSRDAPVSRRVREDHSQRGGKNRSTADPSLVLRLGRYLRNGVEFDCYVCGKRGHHGTSCWHRKPGAIYPEDELQDP